MLLIHPNEATISNRHLDVFVDDTSLGITTDAMYSLHPSDPLDPIVPKCESAYDQASANMRYYHGLLETTGGALAWEKCKVYIIYFCG